jgi:phospholipase C
MGLENIDHVVVLMMENRSLDNLLGWLYPDPGKGASSFIPSSDSSPYDGLVPEKYFNRMDGADSPKVFASHPPKAWPPACPQASQVPTPDPHEEFEFVTQQLFGSRAPVPGVAPDMSGFLQNYSTTKAGPACAGQMMESFGPGDVGVINALARNFAVSDRWFASAPTQTWPNRGFVHSGSSDGHVNNENYEPYGNRTIFNVLEDQGKSWGVFHDSDLIPSLTHIQFLQLWDKDRNMRKFPDFERLCAAKTDADERLPSYSFVEPRFVAEPGEWWRLFKTRYPSDYHPPHDVMRGDQFLARVYGAVRASPYRDNILLIVTFDEHGGCYDHVPPPWGSVAPEPGPVATANGFKFDRFGVRVPTIIISSYVKPGSVFRAEGDTPYDHTSILATLRDWPKLGLKPGQFLPSPRIAKAPKFDNVLAQEPGARTADWPEISAGFRLWWTDTSDEYELNDVQKSLIAHMKRRESANKGAETMGFHAADVKENFRTIGDALAYLRTKR